MVLKPAVTTDGKNMPELRKDPVTGRWVIISTDLQKRPNDFRLERSSTIGRQHCPFCPGHEAMTPPELLSYRQNGGGRDPPGGGGPAGPDKIPSPPGGGTIDPEGGGRFDRKNGSGAHQGGIETPH